MTYSLAVKESRDSSSIGSCEADSCSSFTSSSLAPLWQCFEFVAAQSIASKRTITHSPNSKNDRQNRDTMVDCGSRTQPPSFPLPMTLGSRAGNHLDGSLRTEPPTSLLSESWLHDFPAKRGLPSSHFRQWPAHVHKSTTTTTSPNQQLLLNHLELPRQPRALPPFSGAKPPPGLPWDFQTTKTTRGATLGNASTTDRLSQKQQQHVERCLYRHDDIAAYFGPPIVNVWAHNLEEEFAKIRDIVERFHYVAIDTEFPGVVAIPTGVCSEYRYRTIKLNVDLLRVIQLGITFADERGYTPPGTSTWQFNFKFDLERDLYAENAINFLRESGIDFAKHQNDGIDIQAFGEIIMSSGLVMNQDIKWISFHGSYDFGYLLKLLTCAPLPESEREFFALLHDFFPSLYDIKYLSKSCPTIQPGASLQKVADYWGIRRIGQQHQAGSDSLLTCHTFFRLVDTHFDNLLDDSVFSGVIYGLGDSAEPRWYPGRCRDSFFPPLDNRMA